MLESLSKRNELDVEPCIERTAAQLSSLPADQLRAFIRECQAQRLRFARYLAEAAEMLVTTKSLSQPVDSHARQMRSETSKILSSTVVTCYDAIATIDREIANAEIFAYVRRRNV